MRPDPPPLTELLDLLPDAVCVVDPDGVLLYVSAAFERILGYRSDEVLGTRIFEFVHPQDREETARQAARVMEGEAQRHFRNRYRHKDGHSVHLLWSAQWLVQYGVRLGVAREISELRRVEEELERRAQHDPLTGLLNRRSLQDAFERTIAVARGRLSVSVLFLDLDGFKAVNDSLGHSGGDRVLEEVARRLQGAVREGDLVARIGGDEFVVLLPGCDLTSARSIADNLAAGLRAPFKLLDQPVLLGASVGIATYPVDGEEIADLLEKADAAMYQVKRSRRVEATS